MVEATMQGIFFWNNLTWVAECFAFYNFNILQNADRDLDTEMNCVCWFWFCPQKTELVGGRG